MIAIYKRLLLLYPSAYRQRFGEAMLVVFEEMVEEEIAKQGKVGIGFCWSILVDLCSALLVQYLEELRSDKMKETFQQALHPRIYHIIGAILLLPFILLLFMDFLGRVVAGDVAHPNPAFTEALSHTVLYSGHAPLLWTIVVYGPLIAVLINLIPYFGSLQAQDQQLTLSSLFSANPLAILIVGMGLCFLVIAFGHDLIPCLAHTILTNGLSNLGQTIALCRQA